MLRRLIAALVVGTVVTVSAPASALQCVPFARDISGISIRGDAWTWWSSAVGSYDRGQNPRIGAVVVFQKTRMMHHGHVAVVTQVVNSREVLVDHANWGSRRTGGRGQIAKGMSVVDISPRNDWSQVRVWNRRSDDYGTRVYPTYGFIYAPGSRAARVQMATYIPEPPRAEITRGEQARVVEQVKTPASVVTPVPAPVVAAAPATPAAPQHLARHSEQLMATADLQIASVLTEGAARVIKTEVQDAKSEASAQSAPVSEDQALARRFGSGRY